MKKLYEPISALVKQGVDLSNLLHALIHCPTSTRSSDGYVFLTARENERLATDGVFLQLPKRTIQLMEHGVNEGCFTTEIAISHYSVTTYEDIGVRYLDVEDKDLFEKRIKESDLEPFLEWTPEMPENFKSMKPLERFRMSKAVVTKFKYNVNNIYIRTDSAILTPDLVIDSFSQRYPFLKPDHSEYSQALFFALEGKKYLHIDNPKSHMPGYGKQFAEWANDQKHDYSSNMITTIAQVSNSDCDRKSFR